jgi:G:T-mismatch repair DNA endonuclease (very short patch repair protein)
MNTAGHVCQACWKQPIAVTCGACHKVFPIDRSRYTFWVKNNSTFFCSDECHSKGVGSLISQAKKVNGAEISAKLKANWADPVLRQKRLDGMIPAAFKRRQRTLVTCANCGVQLEKCNCHVRNNRTGNFYCTTKCQLEDPKFYRASMLAAQRRPTKPEQLLIEFFKEYNLPYSYTGDGTTFIGRKNPDFIHTSDKKAIDLFGDYFHSKKFLEKKGVAYDPEGKARIEAFKQHGYDLTVIWEKELNDPNWKQILLAKLR